MIKGGLKRPALLPTSKEDVDSVVGDANLTTGSNEAMAAYTAAISNTLTKIKV